jgi:hypothetical protein
MVGDPNRGKHKLSMELKIYVIKKNLVKNYTTSTSSFRPEKEPKS